MTQKILKLMFGIPKIKKKKEKEKEKESVAEILIKFYEWLTKDVI